MNKAQPPFLRLVNPNEDFHNGLYQQDGLIVAYKGAAFPDKCICCNAPAEGRLVKKTVFWHTPILLPLLLISFPFYLLLAFSFRRIHTFKIPLCRTHYFQRLALTTIGLILLPGFPILALLAINGGAPYWFLTGILTSLSGIASLGLGRNPIWASQITTEMATLRGASPDFVKELPFFVQSS